MDWQGTHVVIVAGFLLLGGCSGLVQPSTETPFESPTPPLTGTPSLVESGADDYPHDIVVENSQEDPSEVTIDVDFNGTEIYRETHTVPANSDTVVAGITRRSLPDDAPSMTITAADARGRAANVTVSVSDCLGDVVFSFDDGGDLQGTYSIC